MNSPTWNRVSWNISSHTLSMSVARIHVNNFLRVPQRRSQFDQVRRSRRPWHWATTSYTPVSKLCVEVQLNLRTKIWQRPIVLKPRHVQPPVEHLEVASITFPSGPLKRSDCTNCQWYLPKHWCSSELDGPNSVKWGLSCTYKWLLSMLDTVTSVRHGFRKHLFECWYVASARSTLVQWWCW